MVYSNGSVFLLNRVMNVLNLRISKVGSNHLKNNLYPVSALKSISIHLPVEVENTDVFSRVP